MKILGTLFRLLCAFIVLVAVAVYLDGSLQVSLVDYIGSFTPEHILALASNVESWPVIAAGALLLLTLCCGLKLGWNMVYSIVTLAFFAETAILVLGPELALPTAARGLGWEPMLRDLALNYPVPALMIPALCIVGCLCSSAPVRIAWTSLVACALTYGCAELLSYGVQYWQSMPEPFLPQALELVKNFPWSMAALPAVFFIQYCLFMAMFETFIPRKKKQAEQKEEPRKEEKKDDKPANTKLPAAATTVAVAATPVVVKRPVVHKKSPVSPAPAEDKKVEKKEEPKPEPAEEAKPTAPEAPKAEETPKAEEAPKAVDSPATEEAPKSEEPAKEEAPAPATAIPSVSMPPKDEA